MKYLARYGKPIALFLLGIALWLGSSSVLESSQASIGPEFLTRIPVKLTMIAVAIVVTRFIVKFGFPTIYRFTDTQGGRHESEFARTWRSSPNDNRLWIAVLVHVLCLLAVSQLLLASV